MRTLSCMSSSEPDIAPWLLRSKVTPPRQLLSLIRRPDLIQRLETGAEGSLIMLEAPGGYGKSCLLSEWKDQSARQGAKVCWLAIDEDDDVETFIAYLAYSAHIAGIDTAGSGLLNFELSSDGNPSQAIWQFLARIERSGHPVHIVLDDFERLSPAVSRLVIPTLLRRLPENATLVIASRGAVDISTVDFDHRGLVTRLGPADLSFGLQEMTRLWKGRLTPRQIERLSEWTEGWPVLIRLLLTASDMGTFDIRHIDEPGYRDMAIPAYFEEKILSRIDWDLMVFLREASVFEEIPFDAIQEVLDQDDPDFWRRLESLEAFLVPLSGERSGYRLHPMMREYLRQTLSEQQPGRYGALQVRAANWYSDRGNHVRAVKHALAAGDETLLIEILEQTGGIRLWLQEGLIEFRAIDRHLKPEIVQKSPTSALMRCVILMKSGKQSDAAALYDGIIARHRARIAADDLLSISSTVMRVMLAVYGGNKINDQDVQQIEDAIRRPERVFEHFEGFILTFKCLAAHQAGKLRDAIQFAHEALDVFHVSGSLYGEVYIHIHLAMIHSFMRQTDESVGEFRQASDLIRRDLSFEGGIKYLNDVIAIEARHEHAPYDQKDMPRLKNLVARLLRAEGWIDIYSGAFRTLSEQIYLAGSLDDALHVLSLALDFSRRNRITSLTRICEAQREILSLISSAPRQSGGGAVAHDAYDPIPALATSPWRVVEAECERHLHLARSGEVTPNLERVTAFRDDQLAEGNLRVATRISALLALVSSGRDLERSLGILEEALDDNRFGRATLFVEDILRAQIAGAGLAARFPQLFARLSARPRPAAGEAPGGRRESIVTQKEWAVLRELHKGQTDKQIALTIGVTEHAIRYHLKNIYAKLNARTRQEAVQRAAALGLLTLS
ncbi:transcriptional regulator, LuxR family [Hyphomonas neptunium ATCC 15444]|uniref:Transcriptional regulator, LuxR family n=2 Tax=Hyphomonas TaxID=85 RepID=Q0BZ97_HYPNA|nr:transcriptional regulator, LuxR family [Hyphomonas neptunium ATCC 15444]